MTCFNIPIGDHEVRSDVDGVSFGVFDLAGHEVATGTLNPEYADDPDNAIMWEWESHLDTDVLRHAERAIVAHFSQIPESPVARLVVRKLY